MDLNRVASVQYNDWTGEVAADDVDGRELGDFLGVDALKWRLLVVDITVYGGIQSVVGYGVSVETSFDDLQALAAAGSPIRLRVLSEIEFDPHHPDTNPPEPLSLPVVSAGEFVGHGFKRLHIRLRSGGIPPGSQLEVVEPRA